MHKRIYLLHRILSTALKMHKTVSKNTDSKCESARMKKMITLFVQNISKTPRFPNESDTENTQPAVKNTQPAIENSQLDCKNPLMEL